MVRRGVYVSGERRIGKGDLITPADRMHLGSLTKAITATLIGALAEKHLMKFDTTIGQAFPELSAKIQPAYRDVSARPLLTYAGMGWGVMPRDGVASHEHVGSYGAYVAYATPQPSRDIAVGVSPISVAART